MATVRVTFSLEADDPKDRTGLTEESYLQVTDAVMQIGGYDIEVEKEENSAG